MIGAWFASTTGWAEPTTTDRYSLRIVMPTEPVPIVEETLDLLVGPLPAEVAAPVPCRGWALAVDAAPAPLPALARDERSAELRTALAAVPATERDRPELRPAFAALGVAAEGFAVDGSWLRRASPAERAAVWEVLVCHHSAGLAGLFVEDAVRGSLSAPVVAPVVAWLAEEGRWSEARTAAARANAALRAGAPSREVVAAQVAAEAVLAAHDPAVFPGHWQTDLLLAVRACEPAVGSTWVREGRRWRAAGGGGASDCVERAMGGAPETVARVVVRVPPAP
jgi:hypothetical protein